jgi:hypothetical protein
VEASGAETLRSIGVSSLKDFSSQPRLMISVLNNNTKKSAARAEPAVTIFIIPLQPLTYTNGCKTDMPSRNFYFKPDPSATMH